MEKNKKYYFLGVSTNKSLINQIFPIWMSILDLSVELHGINLSLNSQKEEYVNFIKTLKNENTHGALVTSHKTKIFNYCKDYFFDLSKEVLDTKEISAVRYTQRNDRFFAHNSDIVGCKNSLIKLTNKNSFWNIGDRSIIILGAGGSGISLVRAISRYCDSIGKILITEKSYERRKEAISILSKSGLKAEVIDASLNDLTIKNSGNSSLVINATGVGKDIPGSPVSDINCFNENSTFWDLNYRGDLTLLNDLKLISKSRNIQIYDGWDFFIDGWLNNIQFVLSLNLNEQVQRNLRESVQQFRPLN